MRPLTCFALLIGGIVVAAGAQSPSDRMEAIPSGSVAVLLANKAVQEELKMTEEDIDKVHDWTRQFRGKASQIRKEKSPELVGKSAATELTREEREKIAAANAEIRKLSFQELGEILKRHQVDRLKQIDLQKMGIEAFSDNEVIAELKLTATQKDALKKLLDEMTKANYELLKEGLQSGPQKIQENQKIIQKNQNDYYGKAVDGLSEEQMWKWKAMIGKKFDLQKLRTPFPKKKEE